MKASLKGHFEPERSSATATFSLPSGDASLNVSITDATFSKGPSLSGLSLSLEKPGSFVINYNLPNEDFRFQFMNTVRLLEKCVSLTYSHALRAHQTSVDGSLTFDPANKLSLNYNFGSGNCKVKYAYAHGELRSTVVEPMYDLSKKTWDFAVSRKFKGGDSLKATYQTSSKALGFEWNRDSKLNGCFKDRAGLSDLVAHYRNLLNYLCRIARVRRIRVHNKNNKFFFSRKISASFNLTENNFIPKVFAESTLNYYI